MSQSHLHRTASGRPKTIRLQPIPQRFISTFTVSISMVWTDGCRNYKRDGGCSNIGIGAEGVDVSATPTVEEK